MKNINYLDPPPPPPHGSQARFLPGPSPPGSGSVFSSLGLPVLDLVLRTFTCSTDSACSFETSVFSVNHLARIFAHAACRTQRCFKTASDASRCFHVSRFQNRRPKRKAQNRDGAPMDFEVPTELPTSPQAPHLEAPSVEARRPRSDLTPSAESASLRSKVPILSPNFLGGRVH